MRENVGKVFKKLAERRNTGQILDRGMKSDINRDLNRLVKNTYFPNIPVEEIQRVLERYDIIMLQEDYTEFDGFFTGSDGRESIEIADIYTVEGNRFTPFENSKLILSWHQVSQSGNYEIVVYVS